MPATTVDKPEELLVDSDDALKRLIDKLAAAEPKRCGIDTEADSLHSYREKLCLIQLICEDTLAIIDPLNISEDGLQQLLKFASERDIWMHGADFDMTLFRRTFGWVPERILDTQLAARLTGHHKFGLANLIEEHFDVTLSKSSQKADWGARPLKEKLLSYAFGDVRYLLRLADILTGQLDELGRRDWFDEWCVTARQNVLDRPERSTDDAWRVTGWGNLDRKGLACLREIWLWRDAECQARDCPPFRVMNNERMLQLAEVAASGKTILGVKGLRPQPLLRFQQAIGRVATLDPKDWPARRIRRGGSRDEIDTAKYDSLRLLRDRRSEAAGLDPTIVATRGTLESLSVDPGRAGELLMNWQRNLLFGDDGNG